MPAIHFGPDGEHHGETWVSAVVKLTLAVAAIGVADYFIFTYAVPPSLRNIAIASGFHLVYLAVAYWIRPEADESDLGLFGPLIDDPFSTSDDSNRALLFIQALLIPGQLTVDAVLFFMKRCFGGSDVE